jgi:hypothetical protein
MVEAKVTYGLPAALYTIELRSGKTVHATLRQVAQGMAAALQEHLPALVIHVDTDPDEWNLRRGTQDIVLAASGSGSSGSTAANSSSNTN